MVEELVLDSPGRFGLLMQPLRSRAPFPALVKKKDVERGEDSESYSGVGSAKQAAHQRIGWPLQVGRSKEAGSH